MFPSFKSVGCAVVALIALASSAAVSESTAVKNPCPGLQWVGAYVPGWAQEDSASFQDHGFGSIRYLLHFAVFVRRDGALDLVANELTSERMKSLVAQGHNGGRKVLLVVGGEKADRGLRMASRPQKLAHTVKQIADLVEEYGYDGVDVDWEPLPAKDAPLYGALIKNLRRWLNDMSVRHGGDRRILTTAIETDLNDAQYMDSLTRSLAGLSAYLDQINLMTYTMADPAELPFVWHNSALYPAGKPPVPGYRTPSVDEAVQAFIAAGVRPQQLGIGIDLHGYAWKSKDKSDNVSRPGGTWKKRPQVRELSADEIMRRYFSPSRYRWDGEARVPYLSIPEQQMFVSYEDRRSIEEKVAYVRSRGLGGFIIWDSGGTRETNANRRLLEAVDDAVGCGSATADGR